MLSDSRKPESGSILLIMKQEDFRIHDTRIGYVCGRCKRSPAKGDLEKESKTYRLEKKDENRCK